MTGPGARIRARLFGPLSIIGAGGDDITPRGRKACAVIAMLIVAPQGARGRRWLQDKLWSGRGDAQGAASLRQTLSEIRRALGDARDLLSANAQTVALDLDRLEADVLALNGGDAAPDLSRIAGVEFLEGLDVRDPQFGDWLADQRRYWERRIAEAAAAAGPDIAGPPAASAARRWPVLRIDAPANLTGDRHGGLVADEVAAQLVTRFAGMRWLKIAQEGGAPDYRISGEIKPHGALRLLSLRLTDAVCGLLYWSGRVDVSALSGPESLTEILLPYIAAMCYRLGREEQARAHAQTRDPQDFKQMIWRGQWHLSRMGGVDLDRAAACFERARDIDRDSPEPLIHLGRVALVRMWDRSRPDPDPTAIRDLAQQVIDADGREARGYYLAGSAEIWLRRPRHAQTLMEECLRLLPSMMLANAQIGVIRIFSGRPEQGLEALERATRLNAQEHLQYFLQGQQALANWMMGNWREAAQLAHLAIVRRPSYWRGHMIKFSALRNLGDAEAAEAHADLMRARPELCRADVAQMPFTDPVWSEHLINELGL